MSHSSIFLISCSTSRSSLYISHSPTVRVLLYFFPTRAHLCIFPLLPTTGIRTSFFLAGPGPLPETAVSTFSRIPMGRANTFSFLFLLLTPRISLEVFLLFHLFLSLACPFFPPFLLLLYITPQTSLWTTLESAALPPRHFHVYFILPHAIFTWVDAVVPPCNFVRLLSQWLTGCILVPVYLTQKHLIYPLLEPQSRFGGQMNL